MPNKRTAHTQLNRGKRLKDVVKLRRPSFGNGTSLSEPSTVPPASPQTTPAAQIPVETLQQTQQELMTATANILEHLAAKDGGQLPAQDERRLARALALLGTGETNEYSTALKQAIQTLEGLTQNVMETAALMVKGIKQQIENKLPAWEEAGVKTRSEATKNLCLSLQILQSYGRGLMGAPDKVEEHRHKVTMDTDGDKDPRDALVEIEQILTGRTIHFLPPHNGTPQIEEP